MRRAQFSIALPEGAWVTEVSRAFPDATFELLAGYRAGDTAAELGEVVAEDPDACIEAMRAHPAVSGHEVLESHERRVLGKYETTDTGLYEFVERSAVPIEFPVVVQDGRYEFDLTGTRDELDRLRSVLEETGLDYELLSVVGAADEDGLLTTRQRELLETAFREGYYEVPRECTLTELAETVGVDKSTASTVVRRGEARVLAWFLAGPETGHGADR